jgi:hypothetical protein
MYVGTINSPVYIAMYSTNGGSLPVRYEKTWASFLISKVVAVVVARPTFSLRLRPAAGSEDLEGNKTICTYLGRRDVNQTRRYCQYVDYYELLVRLSRNFLSQLHVTLLQRYSTPLLLQCTVHTVCNWVCKFSASRRSAQLGSKNTSSK